MIEKLKRSVDTGLLLCHYWGNYQKPSDHISLDLIIIKLEVYRFNLDVSKLFVNYLPNKKDGL